MTTGDYIILISIALLFVLKLYLENLATKEDIAEITKVVEGLKSGVLFEHQRKHDFIQKRTDLFISVLNHVEDLQSCAFLQLKMLP